MARPNNGAQGDTKDATPEKRGRGRPRIEFSEQQVEQIRRLAAIGCTQEEIADWPGIECSVDTLKRNYAEVMKRGWNNGKTSLKRTQFACALGFSYEKQNDDGSTTTVYTTKPNPTMLIWLGKTILGQRETTLMQMSGPDGRPIEMADAAARSVEDIAAEVRGILDLGAARARKQAAQRKASGE